MLNCSFFAQIFFFFIPKYDKFILNFSIFLINQQIYVQNIKEDLIIVNIIHIKARNYYLMIFFMLSGCKNFIQIPPLGFFHQKQVQYAIQKTYSLSDDGSFKKLSNISKKIHGLSNEIKLKFIYLSFFQFIYCSFQRITVQHREGRKNNTVIQKVGKEFKAVKKKQKNIFSNIFQRKISKTQVIYEN